MRIIDSITFLALILFEALPGAASYASPPSDGGYPDPDWTTYQNDQQRTGRTYATLGDANCDLTAIWTFEDSVNGCYFAGPIIKDGKIVQAFRDRFRVFDLATGAVLHEFETGGDQVYCTPAIIPVNIDGAYVDVLFVGYGSFSIGGAVAAYRWDDIDAGPIWVSEVLRGCWETRFGGFTVLDYNGDEILFFERGERSVHAVYAATGEVFPGWNGEIFEQPGFGCNYTITSITTDGNETLFIGVATNGFPGDVYAVNAFTGEEKWRLSTAGGLQAGPMYGIGLSDEGFQAGLAFDWLTNTLYAHSRVTGEFPVDGIMYAIEPETGDIKWVTAGNRVFNATPVVGHNLVHAPTFSQFIDPPADGHMTTFNKTNGTLHWTANEANLARFPKEAILTSGYDADPDLLIALDESGRLHFFDAETGETVLSRQVRWDADRFNYGMCAAIENTLVVSTYYGTVTVLKTGLARPRLQINEPRLLTEIPLCTEAEATLVLEDVYSNVGCSDLNLTFTADEHSIGTYDPTFSSSIRQRSGDVAKGGTTPPPPGGKPIPLDPTTNARSTVNPGSSVGPPPYLVEASWSDAAASGETRDLVIRVNPSLMTRGVYQFYVQLETDDPDFFINDTSLVPEILVRLHYGCQLDTTTLSFGVAGINEQLVTNTGRLGTYDWEDGPSGHTGFRFGDNGDTYFQGSLIYGVSRRRLAMNSRDWTNTSTEMGGSQFRSLQPDPNYIDADCKPAIRSGIVVPDWTTDGLLYQSLDASAVYSTFVDSVQTFYDFNGDWDWSAVADPFEGAYDNDSTIGTITNSRTIGVMDAPMGTDLDWLNQGTIQVLSITPRNSVPISNLGIGHFLDPDINDLWEDSIGYNRGKSVVWAYSQSDEPVLGVVKIPFGGAYEPIHNVVGMEGYQGFWHYHYWDSAYYYMQALDTGIFLQDPEYHPDRQMHVTLVRDTSLQPGDTLRLAQVIFRLEEVSDRRSPECDEILALATVFNKFAGFGRGDVNNDNEINIADIVWLADHVVRNGRGAIPFAHLADVNCDDLIDMSDVQYLMAYYFEGGPPPLGDWEI